MSFNVDLTNCDREPIHIPGQIQPHGFLIVVDSDFIIRYHSENVSDFIVGLPTRLLGTPLDEVEYVLYPNEQTGYISQLITLGKNTKTFEQINPFQFELNGRDYYMIIQPVNDLYLLEFEPVTAEMSVDMQRMIGRSISEMLADKNLQNLLNNSAEQVKKVIGYDRVMIYRFAPDGHGEVIAEAKNHDLEPWLGLHYPATDIPRQARELYKLNFTRLIADVNSIPSKIFTLADGEPQPLDLTCSQLRAVSPIHIQYLKNMEVSSSFSISLLYKKELWGLIACHNYTPRYIDYKARESSKLIGQILSSALEFRQDEENQQLQDHLFNSVEKLSKHMQRSNSIEDALNAPDANVLDVTYAKGAVLIYENNTIKFGTVPADDDLARLLEWIKTDVTDTFFCTDHLSAKYPAALAYKEVASGIIVSTISKEMGEYIIWFKPEQLQHITWAGNPEKPVEIDSNGLLNISPRKSFEAWSETVTARSESWSNEEVKAVIRLKEELTYAINQKASAIRLLNEKLKQAYEELDTFSFTISHDLKNPISVIKSYSQLLTRDASIRPEAQRVIDRIIDRADKMNYMINEVLDYSRIGRSEIDFVNVETAPMLNEIIKDLTMVYDSAKLQVTVGETPGVQGDPVMLSQVFSNLLSNAFKYSQRSDPQQVSIEGKATENGILYQIKDNGLGIDIKQLPKIFELFNRTDNVKDIEGSGVGLAIVKRIVEKHRGKIWVDSEPGKGSTFFVEFSNPV
ncbi:GAF domain-containing protein [Mucilaginibacter sp. UR6-1]|uniref:ATP-binding protein n=1 Tax=Mucilaginibacter sp. UR6-1 TaxID=1435643 RepID=UPI001E315285|nr:ATP-binding protein [Mucilaginibacter sp. UR6-1]MCC8411108.1 GAF domain-containing protein [Mucilaginibacter sp. UR6-1]